MQNSIPVSAPNGDALKLFRPSSAPALELCSHFERLITPSPNARRGNSFHLAIAEILKAKKEGRELKPEMAGGFTDQCDWALQIQAELVPEICGIEQEVTLYDLDKEYITSGTLDLWGRDDRCLELIDWKTGQERDYGAQLAIYGLALMDWSMDTAIRMHTAFVDQQRVYSVEYTDGELRERVDTLIEAVRDPASPYFINAYCGYCDMRDNCPAWAAERSLVGSFFDKNLTLSERFSVLKSDPEKLSRFIVAFRRLKNMVEKVEQLDSVALGMIQSGATMPGLQLIKRKGNETVAPRHLIKLIDELNGKELDLLLAANVEVAKDLWEKKMGKEPFPSTQTGKPTEYLALKK